MVLDDNMVSSGTSEDEQVSEVVGSGTEDYLGDDFSVDSWCVDDNDMTCDVVQWNLPYPGSVVLGSAHNSDLPVSRNIHY